MFAVSMMEIVYSALVLQVTAKNVRNTECLPGTPSSLVLGSISPVIKSQKIDT